MRTLLRLAARLAVVSALTAAVPADAADLALGKGIAEARCGRCHATGATDASPHPIVLPLRNLHTRAPIDMFADARKSGELSGHDEMPMFTLERDHLTALLAYIQSLQPAGTPRLLPD